MLNLIIPCLSDLIYQNPYEDCMGFKRNARDADDASRGIIHSWAFRFFKQSQFRPGEIIKIGPFEIRPVNIRPLSEYSKRFKQTEGFRRFSVFANEITMEMVTNENDWLHIEDAESGIKFGHFPQDERFGIITGYASAIILLLRLRGMTVVTVPMEITGSTFEELHDAKRESIEARFRFTQAIIEPAILPGKLELFDKADVEWIEKYHQDIVIRDKPGEKDNFTFFHDIFDSLSFPNPTNMLQQIWTGIEHIVKTGELGVRRSIRERCAMLLCKQDEDVKELANKIDLLYDFRCKVVHGNDHFSMLDYLSGFTDFTNLSGKTKMLFDSYELLKDLLILVIERGAMPTKKELEQLHKDYSDAIKSD